MWWWWLQMGLFGFLGPIERARTQTLKIERNSQIVNLNPKFSGDFRRVSITHLGGGISRPSGQGQSRDQQAHWHHGTRSQNPQF
jgi:hypothetical protein